MSVNIVLPGRTRFTQAEAKQLEKENEGSGYDITVVKADIPKKQFIKKKTYIIKTPKYRTVTQTINMYEDSFDYMTGVDSCPEGTNLGLWKRMRKKQRLETHLQRLCDSLGGLSYTYKVFDE